MNSKIIFFAVLTTVLLSSGISGFVYAQIESEVEEEWATNSKIGFHKGSPRDADPMFYYFSHYTLTYDNTEELYHIMLPFDVIPEIDQQRNEMFERFEPGMDFRLHLFQPIGHNAQSSTSNFDVCMFVNLEWVDDILDVSVVCEDTSPTSLVLTLKESPYTIFVFDDYIFTHSGDEKDTYNFLVNGTIFSQEDSIWYDIINFEDPYMEFNMRVLEENNCVISTIKQVQDVTNISLTC